MTSTEEVPVAVRRDVRHLGAVLGRVLEESGGPELLERVERLRRATVALRREATEMRRRHVLEIVESFGGSSMERIARAFTVYLQLVNLVEERHRVRVLREKGRNAEPVEGAIETAVAAVRADAGEEALRELLGRMELTPVLTAHPTEARRRTVTEALRRIAGLLERLDDSRLSGAEIADVDRRIAEEITSLWRTDPLRSKRPQPLDEVRAAMALFDATIFRAAPTIYRELDRALSPQDVGARPPGFPAFLRWGSWIGGDRDGHPGVTAAVTRRALEIQSDHALRGLEAASRRVARTLSASERDTPASAELLASLDRDERELRRAADALRRKFPDAPHRRKLELASERLARTRTGLGAGYADAGAFVRDLLAIQRSLAEAGATRLAFGELQHVVWQAETFGFHLSSLEIRQHASVHERASRELASDPTRRSEETAEVLATFRVMAELQERFGPEACRRYIVSFTRKAADVALVYELARYAVPDGEPDLEVVPLFESRADLERAPEILDDVLALPGMRERIDARGRRMEVMLGYSDSAKEVGVLAANLALYRAQGELTAWARRNDVTLTLFHGRGGALGRGGGPANRAILGQAPGSVDGRFKVTEQGEVRFARYGNLRVALRHLEQTTNAVMIASAPAALRDERSVAEERFAGTAALMGEASERAYRSLVERDGFAEFFTLATPVEEIGRLEIGSRPVHRSLGVQDLASLRAIPWVFAWTQNRSNLPGWYGLGSGIAAVARDRRGPTEVRAMYRDWPFFTSFVENAELSLAKADLPIAQLYLELGGRPDLAKEIERESELTVEMVRAVTGHELLAERPALRRAIELRNPYVDALSFLQLKAMSELRAGATDDERARRTVQVTINGVAAGLQNTG